MMGLFSNGESRRPESQKPAAQQQEELSQRQREQEELIQRFDAAIKSLEPVFTEAIGLGIGGDDLRGVTIHKLLLVDLTCMVVAIARTKNAQYLFKEGLTAASNAYCILRRVAPQLPQALSLEKYRWVCESMMANSEATAFHLDDPLLGFGMLAVMREYDTNFGTAHGYTVANLFLTFALALEATPELKGSRILIAYVSALRAFVKERPKPSDPFAEVSPRTKEEYETLGVHPDCTNEELKEAYHGKVNYWHPDKFHAAEIPTEMKELATRNLERINEAYERVTKERQAAQLVGSEK